jgi:hypothetical protein
MKLFAAVPMLQFLRKRARELALEYGHGRKEAEALAERLVARIILRQGGTR